MDGTAASWLVVALGAEVDGVPVEADGSSKSQTPGPKNYIFSKFVWLRMIEQSKVGTRVTHSSGIKVTWAYC